MDGADVLKSWEVTEKYRIKQAVLHPETYSVIYNTHKGQTERIHQEQLQTFMHMSSSGCTEDVLNQLTQKGQKNYTITKILPGKKRVG